LFHPTDQSKYIDKLLHAAATRKIENELVLERKAQKEREAEGEAFGDKEAFVTTAFKQKMLERQRYEQARKLQDAMDGIEY
jgi:coiled-coil domain-containing protein 55